MFVLAALPSWTEPVAFVVSIGAGLVAIAVGALALSNRLKTQTIETHQSESEEAFQETMTELQSRQTEAQEALVEVQDRQAEFEAAYREGMEKLQRRQAEAQERIAEAVADAIRSQPGDQKGKPSPATLSLKMFQMERSHRLVITNIGPGTARVLDVKSLSDPNMLVEPLGLDNLVLHVGETHEILAAPSLATPAHPKVLVTWIDADGTTKSREQAVGL